MVTLCTPPTTPHLFLHSCELLGVNFIHTSFFENTKVHGGHREDTEGTVTIKLYTVLVLMVANY